MKEVLSFTERSVLTFTAIFALLLSSTTRVFFLGTAEADTEVIGIITSSATWTKASSPYSLTGPVAVYKGVTITIEPGVTVNLNEHYIQVNGTLIARGKDNDKIHFTRGAVLFTPVSNGWNEQTGSGSIVENVVTNGSIGISVSVKVTKSSINGLDIDSGSSTVSYNTIDSIFVAGGSPAISNNNITGDFTMRGGSPIITANTIQGRPWARGGAPVISGNKIFDGIHADASNGLVTISNNEISSKNNYRLIFVAGTHADISNNRLIGNNNSPAGIQVSGILTSATITQNQIYGCQTGIDIQHSNVQITKNAIFNNSLGLNILFTAPIPGSGPPWNTNPNATVTENTIANNSIGFQYSPYILTSTIEHNNIQDNTQYNFKLQYPNNITLPNNWWGTTDTQAIGQKIFDFKKDFNVGNVTFAPFLTSPNPNAPPIPEISAPILLLLMTATLTATVVYSKKHKR